MSGRFDDWKSLGRRIVRGESLRLGIFFLVGGTVALFNLSIVWLLSHQQVIPYVAYVAFATECSILVSFLLNDRLTFRTLAAQSRPWYVRCGRFQGAATVGAVVTVVLSTLIYHTTHWAPVIAQATAVLFATAINFSMHRFWTYRGPRPQAGGHTGDIAVVTILGE